MNPFRNLFAAISFYSRIPVPSKWIGKERSKYMLAFLPVTGLLTGGCASLFFLLCEKFALSVPCMVLGYSALPLLITGGFHLDGFLDVEDAVRSYKSREEKLKILKDAHIGAFAVIAFVTYALLWGFALFFLLERASWGELVILCLLFFIARAACGISSLVLQCAKQDGLLKEETKDCKIGMLIALSLQLLAGLVFAAIIDWWSTAWIIVMMGLFFLYYAFFCRKHFGGITGDCAGFFVTVSELVMLTGLCAAVLF